jgi:hypothetical protein
MMKKNLRIVGITATLMSSAGMMPAVTTDDMLQDEGSWMQVVGEGSLKIVDPSLKKGHI